MFGIRYTVKDNGRESRRPWHLTPDTWHLAPGTSQYDPPLFRQLAADPAEELLAVHLARGNLVSGRLEHPARLFVERALFLRLVGEGGQNRVTQRPRRLLVEELAAGNTPGRAHGEELLPGIREAHAPNVNPDSREGCPPCKYIIGPPMILDPDSLAPWLMM